MSKTGYPSLVVLAAILLTATDFSTCSAAATDDVDPTAAISAYARSTAWDDRSAVFGTSEYKGEDPSSQLHRRIKSDFKRYRDGDKIEYRALSTTHYANEDQIINSTDQERRLVIPGIAVFESNAVGHAPQFIQLFRTDREVKQQLEDLGHDDNSGEFLEGKIFLWGSGNIDLPALFNASSTQVQIRRDTLNGQACCIIEMDRESDHYAAWLAPAFDYACLRFELSRQKMDGFKDQRGLPFKLYEKLCEANDFRQIDGKWIAMSGRMVTTIGRANGEIITDTFSVQRQNVMLDPDFRKLGAFTIDNIVDGTQVGFSGSNLAIGVQFEWRRGKIVPRIDENKLRKVMNDLSTAMPIAETGNWTNAGLWAVAIGIGAIILILAAIGFAMKKDVEDQMSAVAR